jgi:TatD DNase family protein
VIDTHAHLDAEEAHAQLERAHAAGVTRVLAVGTTLEDSRKTLALADEHESVFAVLGIHPHEADSLDERDVDELRELFSHPKAVAVGETGLDFFRDYAQHDAQHRLFELQLELAQGLARPVVIHTRAADEATLAALDGHDGTVVLHCFSSPGLLEPAVDHGWYVSFAGNVTYPNAYDLRAAARAVPAERLLVETDSPYLSPQPRRGRPNEPANVVHTVAALAQARGEEAERLAERIDANADAAFGLA